MTTGASPRIDSLTPGTQGFVDQSATIAAGTGNFITTIVGRAPIPDIANDLRASFGIDRIQTQQIQLLQNEQGPNGEPVYGVVNDDRGLIRCVGQWTQANSAWGQYLDVSTANSYIEITFYGMSLNLLLIASSSPVFTVTTDGVLGSTLSPTGVGGGYANRNYSSNSIVPIVTTTLNLHTVKLILTSGTFDISGIEILNSNTSSLMNINPGNAYYKGLVYNNAAARSIAYNQDQSGNTVVTGTKGGRIVRYMTSANTFGQGWTAVNASGPAYGNSAVHAGYEEVVRTYYPREFGAGRYTANDDFSLLTSAAGVPAAFTLDDGTTTLISSSAAMITYGSNPECLKNYANSSTLTFTFVGCGLDLLVVDSAVGPNGGTDYQYQIDGGSLTPWFYTTGSTALRTQKIVSGLSYGTHTFTLTRNAPTFTVGIVAFKVYQPLKPTVPAGAVEICDYNVMATYAESTSSALKYVATGALRKIPIRENVYVGTWGAITANGGFSSGFSTSTVTATAYVQYPFFGSDIELRMWFTSGVTINATVSIDGSSNLSGYTTTLLQSNTGVTWAAGSGAIGGTAASPSYLRIKISGLGVGMHTVKILQNSSSAEMFLDCFDIATPIHVHKHNTYATLQNTLAIGSQGMADTRQIDPNTVSNMLSVQPRKAWAQAIGVQNTNAQFTSGANVPIPDMFCIIKTSGGSIEIKYSVNVYAATSGSGWVGYQAYVDGSIPTGTNNQTFVNYTYNDQILLIDTITVPVSPGFHVVHVWASSNSVTLALNSIYRKLTVREI